MRTYRSRHPGSLLVAQAGHAPLAPSKCSPSTPSTHLVTAEAASPARHHRRRPHGDLRAGLRRRGPSRARPGSAPARRSPDRSARERGRRGRASRDRCHPRSGGSNRWGGPPHPDRGRRELRFKAARIPSPVHVVFLSRLSPSRPRDERRSCIAFCSNLWNRRI